VPKDWISIRVELLSGRDIVLDPPAVRIMLAGPRHTLGDLAESIDNAFARWDLSHLHLFELADGRVVGPPSDDWGQETIDESTLLVAHALAIGDTFGYVFDLGNDWRHRCVVEHTGLDPLESYGIAPPKPVPIWGWGWIPDQYGRRTESVDEE
jgi:hypothetical protein